MEGARLPAASPGAPTFTNVDKWSDQFTWRAGVARASAGGGPLSEPWERRVPDQARLARRISARLFASDERLRATLADEGAFLHTEKLVLVDRQGRLRGVYDGTQPFEIDHLIEDARTLAGEM